MKEILFICSSNVGRSQIAEGFYNFLTKGDGAMSAGLAAQGVKYNNHPHPGITKVMQEVGIDISQQRVQQVTPALAAMAKMIISFIRREELPGYLQRNPHLTVHLQADPFQEHDPEEIQISKFRECRDNIKQIVLRLLSGD